jgi:hypothetical protein
VTNPGEAPAPTVAPELQFTSEPIDVDKEPLFSIDGRVYYIPKQIRAQIALDTLDLLAEKGELVAGVALLRRVVGDEAWEALKSCPGIDDAGLAAVLRIVTERSMGQLEKLKGE